MKRARFLQLNALLDAIENFLVAAFVADQKQTQAGVLEKSDGVVIQIGPAVAGPGQAERRQFFGDFAGAREIGREGVVIEEKFLHLREQFFGVGHFGGDVFGRANAVFVPADGLGPEAESALRRAAAPGVKTQIRMQQIADEILLDLQIALVGIHHPRQHIHVRDQFAFAVVDDFALARCDRKGRQFPPAAALRPLPCR